ncbi:unnamed protein product [Chironomus riparius]|uniref:Uncharacterized protein n=1 Tax=Chironomus riparius TaxID=315576 RepID=A0A9N9RFR1_9DIPT|nr:unnamed protein product [Chironomus riparius]
MIQKLSLIIPEIIIVLFRNRNICISNFQLFPQIIDFLLRSHCAGFDSFFCIVFNVLHVIRDKNSSIRSTNIN